MSQFEQSIDYFNDPTDLQTLTEVKNLVNPIFQELQSPFIEGRLDRVTLEELQVYSDPENPSNLRLVVGKLSTGELTCAGIFMQWTCTVFLEQDNPTN